MLLVYQSMLLYPKQTINNRYPLFLPPVTEGGSKNTEADGHDGRLGEAGRVDAGQEVLHNPEGCKESGTRSHGIAKTTEYEHDLFPGNIPPST
jgi:hypothetical protein